MMEAGPGAIAAAVSANYAAGAGSVSYGAAGRVVASDADMQLVQPQPQLERLIPLRREPRKDCPRCHGRGHQGREVLTRKYIVCPCTQ